MNRQLAIFGTDLDTQVIFLDYKTSILLRFVKIFGIHLNLNMSINKDFGADTHPDLRLKSSCATDKYEWCTERVGRTQGWTRRWTLNTGTQSFKITISH